MEYLYQFPLLEDNLHISYFLKRQITFNIPFLSLLFIIFYPNPIYNLPLKWNVPTYLEYFKRDVKDTKSVLVPCGYMAKP